MLYTETTLSCFPLTIDGEIISVHDIYMEDF